MLIAVLFAIGLVLAICSAWSANRTARFWSLALGGLWLINEVTVYLAHYETRLIVGLWLDFGCALLAGFASLRRGSPRWLMVLALSWIAQVFAHLDFDGDTRLMGEALNGLAFLQLALVASDRPIAALRSWLDALAYRARRPHSRSATASRHITRMLGGPNCRCRIIRHREKA